MKTGTKHTTTQQHNKKDNNMGFNEMFSSLSGEGENSDRIFTKNGAKVKFMNGKAPVMFTILPAMDPNNKDKNTSYLPSILPDGSLTEWGSSAFVYRGIGHGDWKSRASVVSLATFGEECPINMVVEAAKNDQTWSYIIDDGKFGDPNRNRAVIPRCQHLMFCNVYLPQEQENRVRVGIFSSSIAKKLVGENGIVRAPNPQATDDLIQQNYLYAFANGDITSPQGAPQFVISKGTDKGEMSAYEIKFALDSARRVIRIPTTQDLMAQRYDITDLKSYLNVLTADQIVQLLINSVNGRSPSGFHEYALLKLALGSRWQIPDPPSAPGAIPTVQSGFDPKAAAVPEAAPVPVTQPAPQAAAVPPAAVPVPPAAAPEANAALASAVKAGAAVPEAPVPGHIVGEATKPFDKNTFLANLAKKGNQ